MASIHETEPNKVAQTAKLTACLRTLSDIPYTQEIAELTNSHGAFMEMGGEAATKFAPITEARFKAINEIIRILAATNILELSCGLSPRGLIITQDPKVVYVGTDLPDVIREQEILTLCILPDWQHQRPNLRFQETDVFSPEQLLHASSLLPGNVAIVSEGLFQYLERDRKLMVAENIRQILIIRGGLWITTDFLTQAAQAEMMQDQENQTFVKTLSNSTGTDIKGNAFTDAEDIANFIGEAQFTADQFSLSTLALNLSSIEASGANPEQIQRILKMRKVYILRPRI